MKRTIIFTLALVVTTLVFASNSYAQSTGNRNQGAVKTNWVDLNGDGLCDNVGTPNQGSAQVGKGYGKKDGSGTPVRPQDGTGFGKKGGNATASGTHDGTGPKGANARRGNK